MTVADRDMLFALGDQVRKAADGGSERDVLTLISQPLWERFVTTLGGDRGQQPTEWSPTKDCWRVHGSETIVLPCGGFFAASFRKCAT